MLIFSSLFLLPLLPLVNANVEKTIFVAPSSSPIPPIDPILDDLGLERLSSLTPALRTQLNASFPTDDSPGTDSWYFLENLNPGQRYEVRICWLATQPTSFDLTTYTLANAMEDPSLLSSISLYSSSRLSTLDESKTTDLFRSRKSNSQYQQHVHSSMDPAPTSDSVLFLRIRAAADYYSIDQSLMENVPPVVADVILDPFLFNVFPKSLVPIAAWISLVTVVAVVVARWVMKVFGAVIEQEVGTRSSRSQEDKKER